MPINPYRKHQLLLAILVCSYIHFLFSHAAVEPLRAAEGMRVESVVEQDEIGAFTWNENGSLWLVRTEDRRMVISTLRTGTSTPLFAGSFERKGNERPGLLVHGTEVYIGDGDTIRVFQIGANGLLRELTAIGLPTELFPTRTQIHSFRWSLLGGFAFQYVSSSMGETGIGRIDPKSGRWDIVAKGLAGAISFDEHGFLYAADFSSSALFRVGLGLDYVGALHNFTKIDLALQTDLKVKPSSLAPLPGAGRPKSWAVSDAATSKLLKLDETEGHLTSTGELAEWSAGWTIADVQLGPDTAIWILLNPTPRALARSKIYRLFPAQPAAGEPPPPFEALSTADATAEIDSPNSWRREAALRVLERREDLLSARGLHPKTALHARWEAPDSNQRTRLLVLLGLHRTGLLEEGWLENGSSDSNAVLRAWSALLFGERNYPTGTAFKRLEKLAQETNLTVRASVAIAARQLISSSLAVDLTPRSIPVREVFTGGILSTLWFSTEKGTSPEFELLYWNAVRPIVAFDPAHPLGFFQQDEDGMAISSWMVTRIAEQIAMMPNPLKQEDGLQMLKNVKNHRLLFAAFHGLALGTERRKVTASRVSMEILESFANHSQADIARKARELLKLWSAASE